MINALIFPGQGSQALNMGYDLYHNYKLVKELFDEINDILQYNLTDIMFNGPIEKLTQTNYSQLAIMATSIATIEVIKHNIKQDINNVISYVAGHSLGEYSALYTSNVLTLQDTVKLLQIRSEAMHKCATKTKGAMLAVINSNIDDINDIIKDNITISPNSVCDIANDNNASQIIISGNEENINIIQDILKNKKIKAIKLKVSGAFHSELMNDAATKISDNINDFYFNTPKINILQNVTADIVSQHEKIKQNLISQITSTVKWRETIDNLSNKYKVNNLIEIGNGQILTNLAKKSQVNFNNIINSSSLEQLNQVISLLDL